MKNVLLIALLFSVNYSFSQAYMDSIADRSCECINELPDTISNDEFTMRMGLCMMTSAEPYQKKLKKDFGVNFSQIADGDDDAEELGKVIGMRLISRCPDFVTKINKVMNSNYMEGKKNETNEYVVPQEDLSSPSDVMDPEADDMLEVEILEGVITKIENENFVVFSLRDETGKVTKFYWLTFVEADVDLSANYQSFLDKNVEIGYVKKEFYDPKINEYRTFNVIFDIYEVVEEE